MPKTTPETLSRDEVKTTALRGFSTPALASATVPVRAPQSPPLALYASPPDCQGRRFRLRRSSTTGGVDAKGDSRACSPAWLCPGAR